MSTKGHTTMKLGDLVVVAFDWPAQSSADPREIPFLATKAVTYLLRHSLKTSPSRPAPVLLPPGASRDLPLWGLPGSCWRSKPPAARSACRPQQTSEGAGR